MAKLTTVTKSNSGETVIITLDKETANALQRLLFKKSKESVNPLDIRLNDLANKLYATCVFD
jgi:hypothetical protein